MPTNLDIDQKLLDEVLRVSGKETLREALTVPLTEFVQRRRQRKVLELFGRLRWSSDYDHKREREREGAEPRLLRRSTDGPGSSQ